TLDALIARHGVPAFIKIDVEGFEAEVLAGLSRPVAALSFEFTTIQRGVATAAIDRCGALGYASFNGALGESQMLVHEGWGSAAEIAQWGTSLPHAANSGDVDARISEPAPLECALCLFVDSCDAILRCGRPRRRRSQRQRADALRREGQRHAQLCLAGSAPVHGRGRASGLHRQH